MRASFRTVLPGDNLFKCKRLLYAVGGERKILGGRCSRGIYRDVCLAPSTEVPAQRSGTKLIDIAAKNVFHTVLEASTNSI